MAVIVTGATVGTFAAVIENVADVLPAGMITVAGTDTTAGFELLRYIVAAVFGIPLSETVFAPIVVSAAIVEEERETADKVNAPASCFTETLRLATIIVAVRETLRGLASVVTVTAPPPVWVPPDTVAHESLLELVHEHCGCVWTERVAAPPFEGMDAVGAVTS